MLCCVQPPNFKKALQVCSAARPVTVYTLGRWRHNGFDLCYLCQVLQGTGSSSKPAQADFVSATGYYDLHVYTLHALFML